MRTRISIFIGVTTILLLTVSATLFGQVYKLKSTSFSSCYRIDNYNWSKWTETEEASALITFDVTNDRITIYSKVTQVYDIAEYEGKTTDKDGDDTYSYYCVDKDGVTCRVRWFVLTSQDRSMQLYVNYKDVGWLYN